MGQQIDGRSPSTESILVLNQDFSFQQVGQNSGVDEFLHYLRDLEVQGNGAIVGEYGFLPLYVYGLHTRRLPGLENKPLLYDRLNKRQSTCTILRHTSPRRSRACCQVMRLCSIPATIKPALHLAARMTSAACEFPHAVK